jgi:hypothetical protein
MKKFYLLFCINIVTVALSAAEAASAPTLPDGVALTKTVPQLAYCPVGYFVLFSAENAAWQANKSASLHSNCWKMAEPMIFDTDYLGIFVPNALQDPNNLRYLNQPIEYVAEMVIKRNGDKLPTDPEALLAMELKTTLTTKMTMKVGPLPLCYAIQCLVNTCWTEPAYNVPERRGAVIETFTTLAQNTYPNLLAHKPVKGKTCYGPLGFALNKIFEKKGTDKPNLPDILIDMIKILIRHHPLVGKVQGDPEKSESALVSPFDLLTELHLQHDKSTITHQIAALFLVHNMQVFSPFKDKRLIETKNKLTGLPEVKAWIEKYKSC